MLAIVATNFWLAVRAQSHFEGAMAARDTRVAAVELRSALQTAEASQRGFVTTGNEIYLGPYQSAKSQAKRHLSALQTFLPSYAGSTVTLKRLSAIIAAKFDQFDKTIALKGDGRGEEMLSCA